MTNAFAHQSNWGRWGADDECGTLNLVTVEKTLAATRLPKSGLSISLGQALGPNIIVPRHRKRFERFMTKDSGDYKTGNLSRGGFKYAEDVVSFASHTGTHLDALSHVWREETLYNGHDSSQIRSASGAKRCGAERLRPIATRGVLLDVAKFRPRLGPGDKITESDLAAAAAGCDLEPGDAVLIRTGWIKHAFNNPNYFLSGEPGLDLGAAKWLAAQDVALVGADNFAIEVMPFVGDTWFPVHQTLIRDFGTPLLEGVLLDELSTVADGPFLLIVAPIPMVGSTAAPVCPVAVL